MNPGWKRTGENSLVPIPLSQTPTRNQKKASGINDKMIASSHHFVSRSFCHPPFRSEPLTLSHKRHEKARKENRLCGFLPVLRSEIATDGGCLFVAIPISVPLRYLLFNLLQMIVARRDATE